MPAWSQSEAPLPFFQELGFSNPADAIFGAAAAILRFQGQEEELRAEQKRAEQQLTELAQSEENARRLCVSLPAGRKGQKQLEAFRTKVRKLGAAVTGEEEWLPSTSDAASPGQLLEDLQGWRALVQAVRESCTTGLAEARRSAGLQEEEYRRLLEQHQPGSGQGPEAPGDRGTAAQIARRMLAEPALRDRYLQENNHQAFLNSEACPDWARSTELRGIEPLQKEVHPWRREAVKRQSPRSTPDAPLEPKERDSSDGAPPPSPSLPAEADAELGWLAGAQVGGTLFDFAEDEEEENCKPASSDVNSDESGRNGYLWQRCIRAPAAGRSELVVDPKASTKLEKLPVAAAAVAGAPAEPAKARAAAASGRQAPAGGRAPLPAAVKTPPVAEERAAAAAGLSPSTAKKAPPAGESSAPAARKAPPLAVVQTPPVAEKEEAPPAAREAPPSSEVAPPAAERTAPAASKMEPPAATKRAPAVEEPTPGARAAPSAETTAPAASEEPPPVAAEAAVLGRAPPKAREAPPSAERTPPAAERSAPVGRKALPAAVKTPLPPERPAPTAWRSPPGALRTSSFAGKTVQAAGKVGQVAGMVPLLAGDERKTEKVPVQPPEPGPAPQALTSDPADAAAAAAARFLARASNRGTTLPAQPPAVGSTLAAASCAPLGAAAGGVSRGGGTAITAVQVAEAAEATALPPPPEGLPCMNCGVVALPWLLACPSCRTWRIDLRAAVELAEAYVEDCPSEFLCPISMQIMRRPCTTSDGRLYDWASVEEWLATHNTSPLTNVRVTKELVDARSMSRRIERWLESLAGNCVNSPSSDRAEPYVWKAGSIPPEDDWSVYVFGEQDPKGRVSAEGEVSGTWPISLAAA